MKGTNTRPGHPAVIRIKLIDYWPPPVRVNEMLYDVFLHELGHLQPIKENARSARLRFAHEKLAQAFAVEWCNRLWAEPFPHPDPVHNAPTPEEFW